MSVRDLAVEREVSGLVKKQSLALRRPSADRAWVSSIARCSLNCARSYGPHASNSRPTPASSLSLLRRSSSLYRSSTLVLPSSSSGSLVKG